MKSLIRTINSILKHPLNQNNKIEAFVRFFKWQIGSRLVPGPALFHWLGCAFVVVKPGEHGFTQNIYCGLQELEDMAYILHVVTPDDVFVDIGANIGAYTLLACVMKGAKGHAFEPVPETFQRLVFNLKINDAFDKVEAHNLGLADKADELFFTSSLNTTNHVVTKANSSQDAIRVKVKRLDDILDISPTIIKIDVEGYETFVLNGMTVSLDNPNLHSVIIELNGSGRRYGVQDDDIVKKMLAHGFFMYHYLPFERDLRPIDELPGTGNVLFIRSREFVTARIKQAEKFIIEKHVL